MRIAICLSGQPRTIDYSAPNILQYFSGDHDYDFFCHSWDYNTYKRKKPNPEPDEHPVYWDGDESVDVNWLTEKINLYKPKKFTIESVGTFNNRRFPWDSLSYSMMCANNLKKQYEIENNFRYDFVVRSRYDIIFDPTYRFTINDYANRDNHLDIFCTNEARMDFEFSRINVSDEFFYGSSTAMDMLSDLYRRLTKNSISTRGDDWEWIGPGASMSDYAEDRNLRLRVIYLPTTVFRPEVVNLNPLTDYGQIANYSISFYKN